MDFFVGERRIRVHTLCLPVTNQLSEVYASADQQAIVALLAKMGKELLHWKFAGNVRKSNTDNMKLWKNFCFSLVS